jgi:adenylate cyclase
MTAIAACRTCGTEPLENARFCHGCGSPVKGGDTRAEYKQVTVLFADVVHSMDIAAAVGAERLREIMAQLVDRAKEVVQRYEGTVDKFTGDGIMAVFGAPVALEDHAVRACLAALGVQDEAKQIAVTVRERDGVDLQLRVGLNSGQVVAGEIGSGALGYTAVGEQVGMAQRMESAAPPGGVMLSASTARLVENSAVLGEPEIVQIKGAGEPVAAQRLLGMEERRRAVGRVESNLVGRRWELSAVEGLLDRAVDGHGAVVGVVGPPGVGKSRLMREVAAIAGRRGVEVFTTFCESHASQIPFHAVARLLRAATGVRGLYGPAARAQVRAQTPDADPEDLLLFDDLLGIADPDIALPRIDPDARRRRLTALVIAVSLARETPAVYVVEDAHWIDEVSESMLAEFLTVIPQTPSLVLFTYRPEYRGALSRVACAQTVALKPLSDSETTALVADLLGPDPSVGALGQTIADRAAGNPFFAEEIVRELAERGVLRGQRGAYLSTAEVGEIGVPATLQATIAARIDRLDSEAKHTLCAAAVVGSRFGLDLLTALGVDAVVDDLLAAQLIDQISFTPHPEYVFHHPLIRAVAYEVQLRSDRAELHRRVAAAIEVREPDSADENAALIAEHLEGAGDLRAAFDWHMRAGTWLRAYRDIRAARTSLQRAKQIADRLPTEDPGRAATRIAVRARLCATAWRAGESVADTGFNELRDMATATDDKVSLAIGMAGQVFSLFGAGEHRESSEQASELAVLLESIGDPTLTVALLWMAANVKLYRGEITECLRLTDRTINLADGDPHKGDLIIESPLTLAMVIRAVAQACVGYPAWKEEIEQAAAMVRSVNPGGRALMEICIYSIGILNGLLVVTAETLRDTAETLKFAEQRGDDYALAGAQLLRGVVLIQSHDPLRANGFELLAMVRGGPVAEPVIKMELAREKTRTGDLDGAIVLLRTAVDDEFATGERLFRGAAVSLLVESLLQRSTAADVREAETAIERLAAVPVDVGFVLYEVPLLRMRALLARAHGDEAGYREFRDRYRDMARTLGFEGHIEWAEAMP